MHFIVFLFLSFSIHFNPCNTKIELTNFQGGSIVNNNLLAGQSKARKKRIRWKHVFRPIKIFKKKYKFWLLLFGGIALGLGGLFFLLDLANGVEGLFFKILFGIMGTSALLFLLCLFSVPIIFLIRIIKEIKWSKRYTDCFKGP